MWSAMNRLHSIHPTPTRFCFIQVIVIVETKWPFGITIETEFRAKSGFMAFVNEKTHIKLLWDPPKNRLKPWFRRS